MITWKNLDTLAAYAELQNAQRVDLIHPYQSLSQQAAAMCGQLKAGAEWRMQWSLSEADWDWPRPSSTALRIRGSQGIRER